MPGSLNEDQIKDLVNAAAKAAASEAVYKTLIAMGIDAQDPIGTQQDMAYLRKLRSSSDKVREKGLSSAIAVVVGAGLTALWWGIKEHFNK